MGLLILLSTNGLCSSRVQGELDGVLRGTQLSGTSAKPMSCVLLQLRPGFGFFCGFSFHKNFSQTDQEEQLRRSDLLKLLFWLLLLVLQLN